MDIVEIGAMVRKARLAMGLTQEAIASASGVSRATLNGLEGGRVRDLGYVKIEAILRSVRLEMVLSPPKKKRMRSARDIRGALGGLARRYLWWNTPGCPEVDPARVIAQVMDLGTYEDVLALIAAVGRDRMAWVLRQASPGWLSPRSWTFWHVALGLSDCLHVPPLPARRIDAIPDPSPDTA